MHLVQWEQVGETGDSDLCGLAGGCHAVVVQIKGSIYLTIIHNLFVSLFVCMCGL